MKNYTFYIKNFSVVSDNNDINLKNIPLIERRKLNRTDKFAIQTISDIFNDKIEELVFASKYGEFERLKKIIEQYKNFNEASPKDFSASVHNYPVGFFTLVNKTNIPYYALSSGKSTISAGLLKCVFSRNNEVLFCYTDETGVSCVISKKEGKDKIELIQEKDEKISTNEFKDFVKFLNREKNIFVTEFGTFRRVNI